MYKHLLIASDGSDLAQKAVEHGLTLARALNAQATVITVTEPWDALMSGNNISVLPRAAYDENVAMAASKTLTGASDIAGRLGLSCGTLHVRDRFAAEGIIGAAAEKGCDLIVMASHGRRGLKRLLLGSVTSEVVTHSAIPVLIYR